MSTTKSTVTGEGKAPSSKVSVSHRDEATRPSPSQETGEIPREQRLEIALEKVIKYHFGSYAEARKWRDQYQNDPKCNHALMYAIKVLDEKG